MENKILTGWKSIAKCLGISPSTAVRWAKRHKLPFTKVENSVISTEALLVAWVVEMSEKKAQLKKQAHDLLRRDNIE